MVTNMVFVCPRLDPDDFFCHNQDRLTTVGVGDGY